MSKAANRAASIIPPTIALAGRRVLDEVFSEFPDVQSALIATPDGFVVADFRIPADKDGSQMAAMAGSMMAMARAVATEVGHAGSRRLIFETDDGTAIFQHVPSEFPCIVCLVVRKEGVLGRALWAVGEASAKLSDRLHV